MDWAKVSNALKLYAESIRERAVMAFPNDVETQREMRTRAALLVSIANAIECGIEA